MRCILLIFIIFANATESLRVNVTLIKLLKNLSTLSVKALFQSIVLRKSSLLSLASILECKYHDFRPLFISLTEKLQKGLLPFVDEPALHNSIFRLEVLASNYHLALALLDSGLPYYGELMGFNSSRAYQSDIMRYVERRKIVFKMAVKQTERMESLGFWSTVNLRDNSNAEEKEFIVSLLLEGDVTPLVLLLQRDPDEIVLDFNANLIAEMSMMKSIDDSERRLCLALSMIASALICKKSQISIKKALSILRDIRILSTVEYDLSATDYLESLLCTIIYQSEKWKSRALWTTVSEVAQLVRFSNVDYYRIALTKQVFNVTSAKEILPPYFLGRFREYLVEYIPKCLPFQQLERTLEERRRDWIFSQVAIANTPECHADYVPTVSFGSIWYGGIIELNKFVIEDSRYPVGIHLSDLTLKEVEKILARWEVIDIVNCDLKLTKVFLSWLYLLAEMRKLNFKQLFHGINSWNELKSMLSSEMADTFLSFFTKLERFFSLHELFQLIDESYC